MIYLNRQEQRFVILLGFLLIISTGILLVKRFQPSWVLRITMGEPDFDAKEENTSFYSKRTYIPSQRTQKQQIPEKRKENNSAQIQNILNPSKTETPSKIEKTDEKININTASKEELEKLPGIGPVKAQRIIDYRTKHGNFTDIDQLTNVEGIGEKTLQKMRDSITLGD